MPRNILLLLIFASVSYLAYAGIPALLARYSDMQKKRMEKVTKQLDQMFVFKPQKNLIVMFMVAPLSLATLGFIFFRSPVAIFAGLAFGLLLPKILVNKMAALRVNKFNSQLVDGLMLLSSSLRAGLSLSQAFEVLAEEMPPPIRDEFALVVRENKMGVAFEECLQHLRKRIPTDDLYLITTAINIARETGGNLTEIFDQLVFAMREKKKLESRVKALTVQGRLQGYIMMVLPVAFAIFVHFVNPENFQILLKDRVGQMLLMWSVVSQIIGVFFIRKFSRIEV